MGTLLKIRLGRLSRIGIVVSVFWMIGAAVWAIILYGITKLYGAVSRRSRKCSEVFGSDWPRGIQNHWLYAALIALAPIPLGCLNASNKTSSE